MQVMMQGCDDAREVEEVCGHVCGPGRRKNPGQVMNVGLDRRIKRTRPEDAIDSNHGIDYMVPLALRLLCLICFKKKGWFGNSTHISAGFKG